MADQYVGVHRFDAGCMLNRTQILGGLECCSHCLASPSHCQKYSFVQYSVLHDLKGMVETQQHRPEWQVSLIPRESDHSRKESGKQIVERLVSSRRSVKMRTAH